MNKNIKELSETLVRKAAIDNAVYKTVDLGIRSFDDETKNIMSSTFGVIKNNLQAFWASVGLEPNVNIAYQKTMTDPDLSFDAHGKKFYLHPGVGNLKAYNEAGNPSGGAFTISTLG